MSFKPSSIGSKQITNGSMAGNMLPFCLQKGEDGTAFRYMLCAYIQISAGYIDLFFAIWYNQIIGNKKALFDRTR